MDELVALLRRLQVRLTFIQWTGYAVTGLLWAAWGACLWLVCTRLFPTLGSPGPLALGLAAAALAIATAWCLFRRPTLVQAALAADRRFGLKERLTSSYELGLAERQGPMVDALHEDARAHAGSVNVHAGFPLHAPGHVRWLALPLALYLVGHLMLPEFDLFGLQARQLEEQRVVRARQARAERLRNVARPLREELPEESGDLSALAESVERIALGLEEGELTETQAAARLSDLAQELAREREQLAAQMPTPNEGSDPGELSMLDGFSADIENGNFGDAEKALEGLEEKLKDLEGKLAAGELSGEDADQLAVDLSKLAEMLGGENTALGDALAKALAELSKGANAANMLAALEGMKMSLEDLKSLMEQLKAMDGALAQCAACQAELLGRACAAGFCPGPGRKPGQGLGLRGPGRGQGNRIGDLPDTEGAFEPSMLSGDMTKGKILASIMQRAAPDPDAETTLDFTSMAIEQVTQQAEEALTQEEIPPGAREYVRQYFGSLESGDGGE